MKKVIELIVVLMVVALLAVFLRTESGREAPEPTPTDVASTPRLKSQVNQPLVPLEGGDAPELTESTRVTIQTDQGEVILELYPQAAPNAYERFMKLVDAGFYNNTYVSRVVTGFVAQFGINPEMADWKEKHFDDDPSYFQHLRGTIAFAKAGPNTNSTQVFINLAENNRLAEPGLGCTVFGKVVSGMDVVESFEVVGNPSTGMDQSKLWTDVSYPETLDPPPTKILKAHRTKTP